MTLQAKIQFGDNTTRSYNKEYRVVSSHSGVKRMFNAFTPQTAARGTDITVTIISPSKEDLTLYEWFASNSKMSGRLLFDVINVNSPSGTIARTFYFYDAQCVVLKDIYSIHASTRRQLTLVFTPTKIKIEETLFSRDGVKEVTSNALDDDDEIDMEKYNQQYDF